MNALLLAAPVEAQNTTSEPSVGGSPQPEQNGTQEPGNATPSADPPVAPQDPWWRERTVQVGLGGVAAAALLVAFVIVARK